MGDKLIELRRGYLVTATKEGDQQVQGQACAFDALMTLMGQLRGDLLDAQLVGLALLGVDDRDRAQRDQRAEGGDCDNSSAASCRTGLQAILDHSL
ncbi:MAG: hypothetical protein IT456_19510 [Planctomycetes bacterium]|nr:hypothetical protein [Planctomycetota bacterium]